MRFTPSPHPHDRGLLITAADRERELAERAQLAQQRSRLLQVVSRGDISTERARVIAERDINIAQSLTDHHGIGATESFMFEGIDAAQRVGADDPQPLAPFFVSNSVPARLGRVWDAICNLGRDLLAYLRQPSPFN